MSLLKVITIPNPNLRKPSASLSIDDIKKLGQLIPDMIDTMYSSDGIGLAAPQIAKNIRLAVIGKEATPDHKDWVIINPEIISHSWRGIKEEEGCLSVPGVSKEVWRYKKIKFSMLNLKGEKKIVEAADFFARVIQHETDHLNGILIIDK